MLLKSFPALVLVFILVLSFAAGLPLKPTVTPSASGVSTSTVVVISTTTTTVTSITNSTPIVNLDIHVVNQYGVWVNGAVVEVFSEDTTASPATLSLVANGTTNNGLYYATRLVPF